MQSVIWLGMSDRGKPSFLARGAYRQRRLRDVARSVPIIGLIVLSFPLLWNSNLQTSLPIIYVFGAWFFLVVVAGIVSAMIRDTTKEDQD